MYLVVINKDNLPQDVVLVTADREKALAQFLETCGERLSNWDEYTADDKEALLDQGYELTGDNTAVVLIDTDGPTSDAEIAAEIADEVHYVWKELATVEGETEPRLLTPWGDPMAYEDPFDYLFDTVEAAREQKKEQAADEDWVLCMESLTRVS